MNEIIHLLIICHLGLTSNLLCQKIQSAANTCKWNIQLTSTSSNEWDKHLETADVILLEPQVAYLWDEILPLAESKGIPLAKVHPVAFATMNGEAILDQVFSLLLEKNECKGSRKASYRKE